MFISLFNSKKKTEIRLKDYSQRSVQSQQIYFWSNTYQTAKTHKSNNKNTLLRIIVEFTDVT